jgi:TonB family protein
MAVRWVVVALSMIGCATGGVRHWAASTLMCQERDVTLTPEEHGVWEATGCGGAAICTVPAVAGAEAQCYRAGTLEKESIPRVISERAGEIRYCYERQLTKFPKLAGTVAVKFVITPTGAVRSSQVARSTVGNAALEQCVAAQLATLIFPKPKGEGSVIVTYPFIFEPSDTRREMSCDRPSSQTAESKRGSLDKDLIRQVIREHLDEISYCQEREVRTSPNLYGTVAVKFIISPTGAVCASEVAQSTVDNAALELCVAARVRTWTFPKPTGEGSVMLTYPFSFEPSAGSYETWSPHAPIAPNPEVPTRIHHEMSRPPRR